MSRTETIRTLWATAEVLEVIHARLQQRRSQGASPQLDAELARLKNQFVAVGGTIVPEHLRDLDNVVRLVSEIEAGRAVDVPSAIASLHRQQEAERDAEHQRRMQHIAADGQHQASVMMHSSMLAEGRRTRRVLRAPWRRH